MESEVIDKKGGKTKKFDLKEVQQHASVNDCWVIHQNNVYDVTSFLSTHPGGGDLIVSRGGLNITNTLKDEDLHLHSVHAYNLLKEYKIGELNVIDNNNNNNNENSNTDGNDMCGFKEDLVDWNKGLTFQVHRFGTDYLKWVHSPVNKQLRLFDSEFIEFFSKSKWYMIPLIWIPTVILCSIYSYGELKLTLKRYSYNDSNHLLSILLFAILFTIGIPLWTLMEYILHRYIFHLEPKGDSPFMITMHFFFHGQHHKVPFDENRLVFPPVMASVFCLGFWKILDYCFPGGIGTSLFCGGLLGYVGYDLIHYYMHHGSPTRGTYLHDMKHYHVLHHFNDPSTGFGISTKFWDFPFNTVNKMFLR